MLEVLRNVVEDMRPHLEKVGIGQRAIDGLLKDGLDHAMILDSIQKIRKSEFAEYVETWLLLPEETWNYYAVREVDLAETRQLKRHKMALVRAWHSRVVVFVSKRGSNGT